KKDRPRQVEDRVGPGSEKRVVDAARPQTHPGEAPAGKVVADIGRWGHHGRGGGMEMAEARVGQAFGQADARLDVFGKTGVITRGEDAFVLEAVAPRQPADRALGRDVDVVRRRLFN